RAALEILEQGGSVVDAAIAGSAMLGLTAPAACGIGGGGFSIVFDASEKKLFVLDYREQAPAGYNMATFRSKQPGAAIGVPGEIAGLAELHRRWGKKTFAEDMAPAVRAAESGFSVTRHLAKMLALKPDLFLKTPYGSVFAPQGSLAKERDRVTNHALGATLQRVGAEGPKAFYEGRIAAELVEVAAAAGSPLSASDLKAYRPISREPLRAKWEGFEVVTMPPPSAGGLLLLETLGIFSKSELAAMGHNSAGYIHMLAEAMRGAIADRMRTVGDPAFTPDKTSELLSPERLKARRARIGSERTHAPPRFELIEHGTSHLVVTDAKGNAVAMTTTVNSFFGSNVRAPQSGVLLNDELADFTEPELAALFGGAPGPNQPRAGARPTSSMTPTIVFRDGLPVLALGGSGGMRIPVNVTQVLLCRLVFGKTLEQCLAAPRFLTPPTGPILSFNTDQLPSSAVQLDLMERGEQVKWLSHEDVSAVHLVAIERTGASVRMQAAGDPRKGGVGLVR
ncbi:MAG TPA: gamma-glutamyltransferase, partial [Polyangiaceae bacterium]